jgi:hypothetical protein
MIKSVEFREGTLHLAIACARASASGKCKCRIQFDFGESGAVAECHRGKLMDFVDTVYAESPHEVRDMVLELLCTEPRISWIGFDGLDSPGKSLKGCGATNVLIDLASGAAERAGG